MINDKKIREYILSIIEDEGDLMRLDEIISEVKACETNLSEVEQVIKALDLLLKETQAIADGMISMAYDMKYGTLEERHGITIEEIQEANRKK